MTRTDSMPRLLAAIVLGAIVSMIAGVAEAQLAYRIAPITDPSSANYVYAIDLNNKGEVVGFTETFGIRAFRWKAGVFTDLGNASNSSSGVREAVSINDRSIIIGTQDAAPTNFMIRGGKYIDVQVSPDDGHASIYVINNRNQIAGKAQTSVFIWERGVTTFLENLPGSDPFTPTARGMNDDGVVIGTSGALATRRAVIWKDGSVMPLDLLPGAEASEGLDINNFEQAVGLAFGPSGATRSFFWADGTTTELLPLPVPNAYAAGVVTLNDWGAVAGTTYITGGSGGIATLWIGGRPIDINTLIDVNDPLYGHVQLAQAQFINERGQIVAFGFNQRDNRSERYLLTPTYRPKPLR